VVVVVPVIVVVVVPVIVVVVSVIVVVVVHAPNAWKSVQCACT
jgi:hypothetical protein